MRMRRLSLMTVICVLIGLLVCPLSGAAQEPSDADTVPDTNVPVPVVGSYDAYRLQYETVPFGAETIVLRPTDAQGGKMETVQQREQVLVLEAGAKAAWTVEIPRDARYIMEIDYCALPGRGIDCELAVDINGTLPFTEAEGITFSRVWQDIGGAETDSNDNHIRPEQEEIQRWQTRRARDTVGFTDEEYRFYFTAGQNTLTLTMANESMAIAEVRLLPVDEWLSYEEYSQNIPTEEIRKDGLEIREAETMLYKSHSMIYATSDNSSPATSPAHPTKIRLNTMGQTNWKYSGQWVTWQVTVPEAGYYRLSFKYRQDFVRGLQAARRLYINGEIPFEEAACLYFPYNMGFENLTLGNGEEDYLFYFNEGNNEITLEVVLGGVSEVLVQVNNIVSELNDMYRKIIMITGTQPDLLRDYYLDRDLPDMLPTFERCADSLRDAVKKLEENGTTGGEIAFFEKVANQLDSFIEKPETIQERLDSYKNNVSSLASTVLSFKEQPLELDYLMVAGTETELPEAEAGFWETVWFRIQSFVGSFTEDYNAVGTINAEGSHTAITVWANSEAVGRDQLAILSRMINNDFVKNHGITVKLQLVGGSILTQAILAGSGPDVSLIIPEATPINLSMRGALADLSKFDGFDEVKEWFFPSAFIPYEYEGGIYGMPETQTYNMLFYRSDIFEEVGATPPQTWDDFYVTSAILQKNKLDVGIPESVQFFETLMLQQGAEYYNDSHTATGFDSPEALRAFEEWTSFYSEYSYPVSFDAYNRFRTGEMPLVLMPISFYNQLIVAAPEIKGKWEMIPLPGYEIDEEIRRSQSATGTCAIMLEGVQHPDACFEFIRWWVSADAQAHYGNEVEAQLGTAARYNTANVEAFYSLPWTMAEQELLMTQWEWVSDVPIIPGDYYVGRNLSNAFRRVVFYSETPREVLNRYNTIINKEIIRKRKEYGLSLS